MSKYWCRISGQITLYLRIKAVKFTSEVSTIHCRHGDIQHICPDWKHKSIHLESNLVKSNKSWFVSKRQMLKTLQSYFCKRRLDCNRPLIWQLLKWVAFPTFSDPSRPQLPFKLALHRIHTYDPENSSLMFSLEELSEVNENSPYDVIRVSPEIKNGLEKNGNLKHAIGCIMGIWVSGFF